MATRIRERIPAHVHRRAGPGGERIAEIEACRFCGTMLHPVPLHDMLRQCGLNRRGYRIMLAWPSCDEHPIDVGDVLEVDGREYPVRAVNERPGCFVEIYTEES